MKAQKSGAKTVPMVSLGETGKPKRIRSTRQELADMEAELARQVDHGNNTITLLINKTGWSRQAINRRLALMVARGQLHMVYRGRGTYYLPGDTYMARRF